MSVLTDIQNELKAPKNRFNKFGNYKYRSCEDILEAIKPLLKKHGVTLTIRDEIVEVGGRVYVKAIAMLFSEEDSWAITAFARESETKKGMDESQITGTASSYARKYALNGLFLIDDTKDADTDEYAEQVNAVSEKKIGKTKAEALSRLIAESGQDEAKIMSHYKVNALTDLTEAQHLEIITAVSKHGNDRKN